MNPAPKFDLLDGKLRVTIGGFSMLEADWLELCNQIDKFMAPVREARADAEKAAEQADFNARLLACQRTVEIDGRSWTIQRHPNPSYTHDTSAWPTDLGYDGTPFRVQVDDVGSARPWTIDNTAAKHWRGRKLGGKGGRTVLRYATVEAAARKVNALLAERDAA